MARLEAAECGVGRFGSVTTAGALGAVLRDAVARRGAIHRTSGRIADAGVFGGQVASRVVDDAAGTSLPVRASLLAVADGGRSELRDGFGIDTSVRDYRQVAIASVVAARAPRERTAFERFTPGGPVALLPMGGERYGLVWSCVEERADELAGLGEQEFAESLAAVFGSRLGGFDVVAERVAFPLRLVRANPIVAERAVLVGNAANHLHPVAGQGFNLGVRDAACLAEVVAAARGGSRRPRRRIGAGALPPLACPGPRRGRPVHRRTRRPLRPSLLSRRVAARPGARRPGPHAEAEAGARPPRDGACRTRAEAGPGIPPVRYGAFVAGGGSSGATPVPARRAPGLVPGSPP